jgi:type II secretory ATPase GspE/PulE/Tfp pilus assembly ATPase PilB-like protein
VVFVPAEEFAKKYGSLAQKRKSDDKNKTETYAIRLFQTAFEKKASDIHLTDYGNFGIIQFRSLGQVTDHAKLTSGQIKNLISVIYGTFSSGGNATTFSNRERLDARIVKREYLPELVQAIRVHTEPIECSQPEPGTFMPLRLLYDRTGATGGLEERMATLGYAEKEFDKFRSLTERSGMVIISGPTGGGKTTLLKHFLGAQVEEFPTRSYMSIEDPPEYPLPNIKQVLVSTNDKDNNADPSTRARLYSNAIAGAMRSDPDVLMIGEIRYPSAAAAAIDAALTGHKVYTTLHANNAIGIILRMVSLLNAAQFSDPIDYLCDHNVVSGLVYQRLVARLCPYCKIPLMKSHKSEEDIKYQDEVLPPRTLNRLSKILSKEQLQNVHILGRGCPHCDKGIIEQTVAAEVIVTDETFLRHIRAGNYDKARHYWLHEMDGQTYVQHAVAGIANGDLDPHRTGHDLGVPIDSSRESIEELK